MEWTQKHAQGTLMERGRDRVVYPECGCVINDVSVRCETVGSASSEARKAMQYRRRTTCGEGDAETPGSSHSSRRAALEV